jgi:hypothetical protein
MLMALVACAAAGFLAAPASAAHRRARHPKPVIRLVLTGADQRTILKRGRVTLRVTTRRAMRLRLYATARPPGRATVASVLTNVRRVKLRPRRARRVSLPLGRAGRRVLSGCGSLIIGVSAAEIRRASGAIGRLVTRSARLRLDPRRCRGRHPQGPGGEVSSGRSVGDYPATDSGKCDPIDGKVCLLPWPNDYFTTADPTTPTHRRVNVDITSTPRNKANKPIDPADLNRNDGWSPGAPIVTKVPGLDTPQAFAATGAVPITDMARTYDDRQPVVLINAKTLARQLIWAEIDSNPQDPANRTLIIHPGVNLDEQTRYIVALRRLRDSAGHLIPANDAFRTYRDALPSSDPAVEGRRAHFEGMFTALAAAGIGRDDLYRAWDFTVASTKSLSERQLSIRDDAYRQLGDTNLTDLKVQGTAPSYSITKVQDFTPAQNDKIARRIEGTYTVPCYLNLPGCPSGSRFVYPPGSTTGPPMPIPGNTMTSHFTCNIPHVAMSGGGARPTLYGHGLFGSRNEVNQGQSQSMGQEHNMLYCATDWVGMACADVNVPSNQNSLVDLAATIAGGQTPNSPNCDIPNALAAENDLSNFPSLVDRVEQSFVNFMYLGRLLIHPDGFSHDPSFQSNGHSVIDTRRLFYDGNSQGGIFGGSLIALEPDLDRGALGVLGMNYAVLLQRSSDFGTGTPPSPTPTNPTHGLQYAYPLYQAYPNELERQLILSLMQNEWDHSDPNGVAAHMTTRPLPNTPAHHVLLMAALGDHQVSNYTAEVEARTIGARARRPWADPGRFFERDPTYGIAPITRYPYDGSAITLWDIGPIRPKPKGDKCEDYGSGKCGTNPAPITNVPPDQGVDPHEAPRNTVNGRQMKSDFLRIGGQITNTCGRRPCYAFNWAGP